ncbi:hypothetical protein U729_455 [Clostridium baratii str. Sullivan]|uniref:Uncharacterized protein n=1 Tax=Clostridium baratii str. Sullivan TaxID=1415775 RepID=A0A0A7FTZ5_9CLOT|nr:hypothetical protein [Clostridium baratii]AIY83058.1 hypothetical protein U729_455 [Clostridium baratii str. Sullivan]MDU1054928.1 hypothetical protein [Clostridium baratii]
MDNLNANENLLENNDTINKEPKRNFRDCIYGNIDISLESMDKFIVVIVSLLFISIILGVIV